jgi:hypothetical protein
VQRDLSSEDNAKEIRKLFGDSEYGCPETVLECTGVESSIATAAFAVRRGGTVMVIGVGRPVINNIPFMHLSLGEVSSFFLSRFLRNAILLTPRSITDRYQIHQQIHRYLARRYRSRKGQIDGPKAIGLACLSTGKSSGCHAHLC